MISRARGPRLTQLQILEIPASLGRGAQCIRRPALSRLSVELLLQDYVGAGM